ncbi:hypothetical protein LTR29_013493 [Friedmanniomyces endolithicus]|nr:hypothetical protein LTR29_013493 [Friedmanniomyces endolithicus]
MLRRRCLFGLPSFEHGSLRIPLIRAIRRASTQPKPQPTATSTSTTTAPNSRPLSRFLPSSPRLSLTYSFTKYFLASAILLHIFFEYFFVLELAWGISMLPTIASANDWVLISKLYRRGRNLHVGDVVSFKHPDKMGEYAVKRIVGLPGDFVVEGSPGKGTGRALLGYWGQPDLVEGFEDVWGVAVGARYGEGGAGVFVSSRVEEVEPWVATRVC